MDSPLGKRMSKVYTDWDGDGDDTGRCAEGGIIFNSCRRAGIDQFRERLLRFARNDTKWPVGDDREAFRRKAIFTKVNNSPKVFRKKVFPIRVETVNQL